MLSLPQRVVTCNRIQLSDTETLRCIDSRVVDAQIWPTDQRRTFWLCFGHDMLYNLGYIPITVTPTRRLAAPVKMSRPGCQLRRRTEHISAPFHLIYVMYVLVVGFMLLLPFSFFISPIHYFKLLYLGLLTSLLLGKARIRAYAHGRK